MNHEMWLWRRVRIAPAAQNDAQLRYLLQAPEAYIRQPESRLLKDDHAATVAAVTVGEARFVIKQYHPNRWYKAARRALRTSKAQHSWQAALSLQQLGFKTLTPLALCEEGLGPLRLRAMLISDYIDGINVRQYFLDPLIPGEAKQATAERVVATLRALHDQGLVHGDTKATNLVLRGQDVYLLDLDDLHAPSWWFAPRERLQDWRVLMHNWREFPDVAALFTQVLQAQLTPDEYHALEGRSQRP